MPDTEVINVNKELCSTTIDFIRGINTVRERLFRELKFLRDVPNVISPIHHNRWWVTAQELNSNYDRTGLFPLRTKNLNAQMFVDGSYIMAIHDATSNERGGYELTNSEIIAWSTRYNHDLNDPLVTHKLGELTRATERLFYCAPVRRPEGPHDPYTISRDNRINLKRALTDIFVELHVR